MHKYSYYKYLRQKFNWFGLGLGWMCYVTLELFTFESELFAFMLDTCSVCWYNLRYELNCCGLGLIYVEFLSVWFFLSQPILSQFRLRMDKGSVI